MTIWKHTMQLPELGGVEVAFDIGDDGIPRFKRAKYNGEFLTLEQLRRVDGDAIDDAMKLAWEAWHDGPIDNWRKVKRDTETEAAWSQHHGR